MSEGECTVRHSGFVRLKEVPDPLYGNLFVAETERHIPFPIRRVYVITRLSNPAAVRGSHAHRQLQQVIFAISGSFTLHLDDGERECDIVMNDPSRGVILGPMLWHTMSEYSPDCVIMVLASDHYRESDYIRDYETFKALAPLVRF